ncbi:MAG: hypothetical protein LQ340_005229 [Diploschistes diacapsis]|nr:MAG: hypothetical protein LQ340_005229 [Diploschistes diacapsis]
MLSRPSKHTPFPPPLYITNPLTPYCYSCGRAISSRANPHSLQSETQKQKYCSARCRGNKPGEIDRQIEAVFVALLEGKSAEEAGLEMMEHRKERRDGVMLGHEDDFAYLNTKIETGRRTKTNPGPRKVDGRNVVYSSVVEDIVFGNARALENIHRNSQADKSLGDSTPGDCDDAIAECPDLSNSQADKLLCDSTPGDCDDAIAECSDLSNNQSETASSHGNAVNLEHLESVSTGVRRSSIDWERILGPQGVSIRQKQLEEPLSESTTSVKSSQRGNSTSSKLAERQQTGQRLAEEREMVRRAARRGVVFGFLVSHEEQAGRGQRHAAFGQRTGKRKQSTRGQDEGHTQHDSQEQRRKCEAVINRILVEPSFAKGDWGIRWRE